MNKKLIDTHMLGQGWELHFLFKWTEPGTHTELELRPFLSKHNVRPSEVGQFGP